MPCWGNECRTVPIALVILRVWDIGGERVWVKGVEPLVQSWRSWGLSLAVSMRWYQRFTLVFSIMSSKACSPSITLRIPKTAWWE